MREVAALKAETAPTLGAAGQTLEAYTRPDTSGRYDGLAGHDVSRIIARPAEVRVAAVSKRYGVDGAATRARFADGVPSAGLARDFAVSERLERSASRAAQGLPAETEAQARTALDRMHGEIGEIHAVARAGHVPLPGVTLEDIRAREAQGQADAEQKAQKREAERAAAQSRRDTEARAQADRDRLDREAREQAARERQRESDPIWRAVQAELAAERAEVVRREEEARQRDREDAERSRRERDGGWGL